MMTRMAALLTLGAVVLCTGCYNLKPAAESTPAGPSAVHIRAYINVSSGCQQATVDYLNKLKQTYQPRLSLEFIDFGDGGEGSERWQKSGYKCMTIEINGSPLVKFPFQGGTKAVGFRMPAGLMWTLEDLGEAVRAAVTGQLQPATEAEIESGESEQMLNAKATAGQVTRAGQTFAAVLLRGYPTVILPTARQADKARARVDVAAKALNAWLASPVKPADLVAKQQEGGWAVLAGTQTVIVVTEADAKAFGKSPGDLAEAYVAAIKHSLAAPAETQKQ